MAQNFRNDLQRNVGTSEVTLITGGDFDAVIGIRCCNVVTSTILVDVFIENSSNDHFLAKNVSVPPNSAIELILSQNLVVQPHLLQESDHYYYSR